MGPMGMQGRKNILGYIHITGKGVEMPTGQPGRKNWGTFAYTERHPGRGSVQSL